ncbi:MAG: hypothetical protein WAN46_01525 [Gammaproteobacteria bacterium]
MRRISKTYATGLASAIFLLLLNTPLLVEIIRKYAIYSNMVFLGGDLVIIAFFALLLLQRKIQLSWLPFPFVLGSIVFLVLAFVSTIISGASLGAYFVGARAAYIPVIYLLISAAYFRAEPLSFQRLYYCASFWVVIAGCLALTQIYLGPTHPINRFWDQDALGIGDYTAGGEVLAAGIFRPTSFFAHTGKFGQVVFCLVLFRWIALLTKAVRIGPWGGGLIVFDILAVGASGQRAAMLFLMLGLLMFAFFFRTKRSFSFRTKRPSLQHGRTSIIISIATFAFTAGLVILGLGSIYLNVGYERLASGIAAAPSRIVGNFLLPIKTIIETYLFYGDGFGMYTFGSSDFGGSIVYKAVQMEGVGESSIIRLSAEVGLFTAALQIVLFLIIVVLAWRAARSNRPANERVLGVFFFTWMIAFTLWSNTADVFANATVMSLGYALAGGFLVTNQSLLGRRLRRPSPRRKFALAPAPGEASSSRALI